MERLEFQALGTTVRVEANRAQWAANEVLRLEQLLTRFGDSPLTRLNREGSLLNPPSELVEALEHAFGVAERIRGMVTPTVLGALEANGYDRSIEQVRASPRAVPTGRVTVPDWREIKTSSERITLPLGTQLDLGGTAKTWIIERISEMLEGDFLIEAGGDITLRQSIPFALEIDHPFGVEALNLELPVGRWGVATSSTLKRAWRGGHHLIDPRSGRPLHSRFVQVSAVTKLATEAEVLTKLALLDEAVLEQLAGDAFVFAFDAQGESWQWNGEQFEPNKLESDKLEPKSLGHLEAA
jgi:FAD:protein FMN transferase